MSYATKNLSSVNKKLKQKSPKMLKNHLYNVYIAVPLHRCTLESHLFKSWADPLRENVAREEARIWFCAGFERNRL